MSMRRTKMMTLGFFLILFGIQLNLVDSVELTPRFSTFLSEQRAPQTQYSNPNLTQSQYSQASFGQAHGQPMPLTNRLSVISIPDWLCWPSMFLGAVLVLQGAIKPD